MTTRVEFKQNNDWHDDFSQSFIDRVRPVLQTYAELLGKNIYVRNAGGYITKIATSEESLSIRFYSIPVTSERFVYRTVFGYSLNENLRRGYRPTGQGIPIIDDEGQACAELAGSTLYILFDLASACENVAEIVEAIIQRMMLSQSPEEYKRLQAELAKKKKEANLRKYVKVCRKRLDTAKSTAEIEICQAQSIIIQSMQKIVEATRNEEDYRRRLKQLNQSVEQEDARFALEYEKLYEVPGVIAVEARDDCISVFTDMIEIKYGRKTYEIGRFRIDIQTDGSGGGVLCFNLTKTQVSYAHPHIKSSGKCCLGNISEGVAQLIASYEYSTLAQLMLNYLRSYNASDHYMIITQWPVKKTK